MYLRLEFRVVMAVTISTTREGSCLIYGIFLFAYSGVLQIDFYSVVVLFLLLVYPLLPVSLSWPFLIASSIFSTIIIFMTIGSLQKIFNVGKYIVLRTSGVL